MVERSFYMKTVPSVSMNSYYFIKVRYAGRFCHVQK